MGKWDFNPSPWFGALVVEFGRREQVYPPKVI